MIESYLMSENLKSPPLPPFLALVFTHSKTGHLIAYPGGILFLRPGQASPTSSRLTPTTSPALHICSRKCSLRAVRPASRVGMLPGRLSSSINSTKKIDANRPTRAPSSRRHGCIFIIPVDLVHSRASLLPYERNRIVWPNGSLQYCGSRRQAVVTRVNLSDSWELGIGPENPYFLSCAGTHSWEHWAALHYVDVEKGVIRWIWDE